ncbi:MULTISPECIES: phage portal protein [unclassified Bacillus cereus group]|uniref:phage portal protein n=1 Tax=unclassified Bacillus cereus group TaxID=2750818 RepID=UPI0022E2B374|nr:MULTISPECIES: phage portal protein [unclassified Bacillus cereus group]MDA2218769.1 phage portal protein [Bacillus cereus group sp. Bc228]MDA2230168.1 phage portal protein [Bacillus cereus group sp. Bc227]
MAFPFSFSRKKDYSKDSSFSTAIYAGRPAMIISEEEALRIPSVKAAVELISNSISTLPIYLYVENEDDSSIEKVTDSRVARLNHNSNKFETAQSIKKKAVIDYLLYGKSYLYKKDGGLHHLEARNIEETDYTDDGITIGRKKFTYNGVNTVELDSSEVIIIDSATNGLLVDGGKVLSQASQQIEYSSSLLAHSAVPAGVLKSTSRLTENAISRLRKSWESLYQGVSRSGRTIILEEGLEFEPLSMKPDEMQLTDSHKMMISEIARLFNIPESMINSSANKYNSLEQNGAQYLQLTLLPIITAIESALDKEMLNDTEQQLGYFFRFDTSEILRTTEAEKLKSVSEALSNGLISFNEARAKIDMPKIERDYYTLSLGSVLKDAKTGELTIPNMGVVDNQVKGETANEDN